MAPLLRRLVTMIPACSFAILSLIWPNQWLIAADGPPAAAPDAHIVVQVLDEAAQPLSGATVKLQSDKQSRTLNTDSAGEVKFSKDLAESDRFFEISVFYPHDVLLRRAWRYDLQKAAVPDHLTVRMQKGTTVGGIVKNERGEPIDDVKVSLLISTDEMLPNGLAPQTVFTPKSDGSARSDSEGHWTYDLAPADAKSVWVRLEHPDYIPDRGFNSSIPLDQLRAQTTTLVLKKGLFVHGIVTDDQGKPISGARVVQGSDRFGTNYSAALTDDAGKYQLQSAAPGEVVLTVVAKDWMPDLRRVPVAEKMDPVDFKLSRGKTLTVKVLDLEGKPLKGVWIAPDTWRDCRTLVDLGLPRETNAEGIWTWTYAPEDAVKCDMMKQGYMDVRGEYLTARDEPYVVTLHLPLVVSGRVLDAQTKAPIEKFRVIKGIVFDQDRISWERREIADGTDGSYSVKFTFPYPALLVRVEADGYVAADSRHFKVDEGTVDYDFLLQKGNGVSGTVRLPNGQPAAGAEVGLATVAAGINIQQGQRHQNDSAPWTKTDAEGKFSFPPQTEKFDLVVLHQGGVRRVSGDSPENYQQIDLQPWAHLEGKLLLGKKSGAGEQVVIAPNDLFQQDQPHAFFQYDTLVAEDGSFHFDRVLPGKATMGRSITFGVRDGGSMGTYSHTQQVMFAPGQTEKITIGGSGVAVVGKLAVPADVQPNWAFSIVRVGVKQPVIPLPEDVKKAGQKAIGQWYQKWIETAEGKAYQQATDTALRISYASAVAGDGSFRVEDVPPGRYTLKVELSEAPPANQCGQGEQIGTLQQAFEIPDTASSDDQPLDMGTLKLNIIRRLKVGDPAPDFSVTTLDGKTLRLSDLHGKIVLVDFWATWCGPCVAELPNLVAAHDRFGDRENFAMVGLSCDTSREDLVQFVADKKITWPQAMIGTMDSAAATDYGVRGIPSIFLIGSDGAVLAKDLRGSKIEQALQESLK